MVGGRAWCGVGTGLGGGRGRGCPGKFDFTPPRVGGGSEVGRRWGSSRAWGPLARRRLLRGRKGLGPSWEARGAAGPRGSLLRSSNEWAPRRLRSEAASKGKTTPESRLRSHDGGRGGERDEWRKRVGDGLGWNLRALPLRPGAEAWPGSPVSAFRPVLLPRADEHETRENPGEVGRGAPSFVASFQAVCCPGDFTRRCAFCNLRVSFLGSFQQEWFPKGALTRAILHEILAAEAMKREEGKRESCIRGSVGVLPAIPTKPFRFIYFHLSCCNT